MGNPDQKPVSIDFGALLRRHRLAAGLSQEALAERARMSTRAVRALERGERRTPQFETVSLLTGALGLGAEQCRELVEAAGSRTANRQRSIAVGPWPEDGRPILPLSLTRFVGRERELAEILALMREHRLVTLTGTGGIGKTQTALRAATVFSETETTNVCFVGLASLSDPALVAQTIATALHVQEVPNHPLLETLAAFLGNKTQILILDNCEHVIQEVAVVADALLRTCPNVRILATSREALKAAGERAYRLPSVSAEESEALFIDRAQAIDSHFRAAPSERAQITTLCRRLDGIPLAIELAAARVNLLTLGALTEKLNDHFSILTGGERTAPSRQQTMRATIDWSYNLLSAPEQRVFERLSVFAGGCTLAMATSVCAGEPVAERDMLDILSSLVGRSLVTADIAQSEPRYALLESFRQFGRENLIARGEQQDVASVMHSRRWNLWSGRGGSAIRMKHFGSIASGANKRISARHSSGPSVRAVTRHWLSGWSVGFTCLGAFQWSIDAVGLLVPSKRSTKTRRWESSPTLT
jgi:predicted ATPase